MSVFKIILRSCVLREWDEGDVESLVEHANNPNVARNLRDIFPSPYTLEHAGEWILLVQKLPPLSNLAIEVSGEAVGAIGLRFDEKDPDTAEIGFWLGEGYWNRGIMTEALGAFTQHAFRSYPLQSIHACVYTWNPASGRVFKKAGYTKDHRAHFSERAGEKARLIKYSIDRHSSS